jgi:hypothetical protein
MTAMKILMIFSFKEQGSKPFLIATEMVFLIILISMMTMMVFLMLPRKQIVTPQMDLKQLINFK